MDIICDDLDKNDLLKIFSGLCPGFLGIKTSNHLCKELPGVFET